MRLIWIEDYLLNPDILALVEPAGEETCTVWFSSGLTETINVSIHELYRRIKEADRE